MARPMMRYASEDAESLAWMRESWLEEAREWIAARLDDLGLVGNGPLDQMYVRSWSTVIRVPTRSGDVYFKASAPSQAFEAALQAALTRWGVDGVLPVLAADVERAWVLMPDGGRRLRTMMTDLRDVEHLIAAVRPYARLQIDLTNRRDELLAIGVPDQRLARLPRQYEHLLDDEDLLFVAGDEALTRDEHRRLRALTNRFADMCGELDGSGFEETLHTEEFHDGHLFVDGDRYLLFDWGDAAVSHPFVTLRTAFVVIADKFELVPAHPVITRLRDTYLEEWAGDEPAERLVPVFDLGQRVGTVCRALTWARIVTHTESPFRERYDESVPRILRRFLDEA